MHSGQGRRAPEPAWPYVVQALCLIGVVLGIPILAIISNL